MVRPLPLLILVITVSVSLYADNFEKAAKIMYNASFLENGQLYWKYVYPHQIPPSFFCPPQGGWPQNPGPEEKQKVAAASKYVAWTAISRFLVPVMLYKVKPTCRQWVKNWMQRSNTTNQQPPAPPIPANNRGALSTSGYEEGEEKQSEEELVFVGTKDIPLITFNTCYDALSAFCLSLSCSQATEVNTSHALQQASVDANIELATGATYNLCIYNMNKIAHVLQIQNPFDTQSEWYQRTKLIISWLVKAVIRHGYCSLLAHTINKLNTRNT